MNANYKRLMKDLNEIYDTAIIKAFTLYNVPIIFQRVCNKFNLNLFTGKMQKNIIFHMYIYFYTSTIKRPALV